MIHNGAAVASGELTRLLRAGLALCIVLRAETALCSQPFPCLNVCPEPALANCSLLYCFSWLENAFGLICTHRGGQLLKDVCDAWQDDRGEACGEHGLGDVVRLRWRWCNAGHSSSDILSVSQCSQLSSS